MHLPAQLTHDPLDARQFEIAVRRLANALSYGRSAAVLGGFTHMNGQTAVSNPR